MFVIGIDPGLGGAIAFVEPESGALVGLHDMPSGPSGRGKGSGRQIVPAEVARLIAERTPVYGAFIEDVHAMPGQGVRSVYSFGFATGALHGVLAAQGVSVRTLLPREWARLSGLRAPAGATKAQRKAHSRAHASAVFPAEAARFARAKDDGRAEAALIAYAGARLLTDRTTT